MNECGDECDPNASCSIDSDGSTSCFCPAGFVGSGATCTAISTGAIVGMVLGGIALLIVLILVVVCCKRRQNVQSSNRTQKPGSIPVNHDYVDPAFSNTKKADGIVIYTEDNVYEEIHHKEDVFYTKDGEYVDMDAMSQATKTDGNSTRDGHQGAQTDNDHVETKNMNKTTLLSMQEDGDGYLVSTQRNIPEKLESGTKTDITLQPYNISDVHIRPGNENTQNKCKVVNQDDQTVESGTANYEDGVYQECVVAEKDKLFALQPVNKEDDLAKV